MMEEANISFVLRRYFQKINQTVHIEPQDNIALILEEVVKAHFSVFPFHTLHFNLKGSDGNIFINLNRNALIQQLLTDGGGSCFHHNAVFQAILEANQIPCHFIACLVHNPANPETTFDIPTHIALIFSHNDTQYLFDPGWNGTIPHIYPLPETEGAVHQVGKFQVRHTSNTQYPYSFEEIKPDGSTVVRYDFNQSESALKDFRPAIEYLNSETYAFHTLFLFTLNINGKTLSCINRHMTLENEEKTEIVELDEGQSVFEKILEFRGYSLIGFMETLEPNQFKNPVLGQSICPISTYKNELLS